MKALLSELSTWVWVVMILGLAFLFDGDPDVWDRLRDRAMSECVSPNARGGRDG